MQLTVSDVVRLLEEWVPPRIAMDGDKIGLQIGNPANRVNKVLVTLDVTEEVVEEAIQSGAGMIVSHHAVIYSSIKKLRTDSYYGRMIAKLLAHNISVYVAHTNLDIAEGGVNDVLAQLFQLQNVEILERMHNQRLKKLVVFVPVTHHEQVLSAISAAGAGWIGNYSHCSFNTPGVGTFLPETGASPFIGESGKLERVEEIRLETIVSEDIQDRVVAAMLSAHPYEEVAYDLYPLEIMGKSFGMGRVGTLPQEMTLEEFARRVKRELNVPGVRVVGDKSRTIKKVAVVGGSGADWVDSALQRGADVFVTADLKYHDAQDALYKGLAMIDPGHNGMERLVVPTVADYLKNKFVQEGFQASVSASEVLTDPFDFL